MRILNAEATDLFSYERFYLEFDDLGLVFVDGQNLDDGGSNGAGKTSIFRMLTWPLYGETLSGQLADEVIRLDADKDPIVGDTRGIVRIAVGPDEIEVHRHRQHDRFKNKLFVFVNGQEQTAASDKATQDFIDRFLQMDCATFLSVAMFPQGVRGFASGTDAAQKAILERVLNVEHFALAQKSIRRKLATLRERLVGLDADVAASAHRSDDMEKHVEHARSQYNEWEERRKLEIQTMTEELKAMETSRPFVDPDTKTALENVEKEIEAYAAYSQKYTEAEKAIAQWDLHMRELDATISGKTQALSAFTVPSSAPPKTDYDSKHYEQELLQLEREMARSGGELTQLQKQLEQLQKRVDAGNKMTHCGNCGQVLNAAAREYLYGNHQKELVELQNVARRFADSYSSTKTLTETTRKLHEAAQKYETWKQAMSLRAEIEKLNQDRQQALSNKKAWVLQRSQTERKLQKGAELSRRAASLREEIAQQEKAVAVWDERIAAAKRDLAKKRKAENPSEQLLGSLWIKFQSIEKILGRKRRLRLLLGDELRYLELWETGFGNAGVKSLLIDTVTPFLNERANHYLRLLTGGNASVEFKTQRQLASGELREKFDVCVSYKHGFNAYRGMSGGEAHRVDVATMFALGDLSASRTREPVKMRLLDEPFDNLDDVGQERVFELLSQEVLPNVGTLLVMSHDQRLASRFDRRITVVKENGVSRIET